MAKSVGRGRIVIHISDIDLNPKFVVDHSVVFAHEHMSSSSASAKRVREMSSTS